MSGGVGRAAGLARLVRTRSAAAVRAARGLEPERSTDPATSIPAAADAFHRLYYTAGARKEAWTDTWWLGTRVWKCPFDLWRYQELVHEVRPDLIVETGTAFGGSAHYFATLLDLVGHGEVVSIDIEAGLGTKPRPTHPRLTYVTGSSTDPAVVAGVAERAAGASCVMVVLDADHREAHVAAELLAYAPLVTAGSFLVVEDTNVNGHPVAPEHGPGPWEAVHAFLAEHDEFEVDSRCADLFLTFNPGGYLRRTR